MKIHSRKVLSRDQSISYSWHTRRINGTLFGFSHAPGRTLVTRMIDMKLVHNITG